MTELELSNVSKAKDSFSAENGEVDTAPKTLYPKAVFFIITTELSERFSYYGMRAVLTLYLRNALNFNEDESTTIYHTFLLLCYGLPLFWGIIADSFLGKFRTIWIVSILFAIGNVILTASSIPPLNLPAIPLAMIGLVFMAVGTGGMKPCVAPFGGEQFILPEQSRQLQQFFSVFFFAVTVGNMISTVLTPVFRQDVHCFNMESCFPLAFGVPTIIMTIAVGVFVSGKSLYKINNPEGNIISKVVQCIIYALLNRKNDGDGAKKSHWLDYAEPKFSLKLIRDIKGLLRVLVYYLPIPMFFALYEQLGSRWTLMASRMNGAIGSFTIKPDQMQVSNGILMFAFIPVFQTVVYPIFAKCNLLLKPLQRMGVGGFLAALSFLVAGIVETKIEETLYLQPGPTETYINFINTLPCPVTINTLMNQTVIKGQNTLIIPVINNNQINLTLTLNETCNFEKNGRKIRNRKWEGHMNLIPGSLQSFIIFVENDFLQAFNTLKGEDLRKSNEGNSKVRIISTQFSSTINSNLENSNSTLIAQLINRNTNFNFTADQLNFNSTVVEISPNTYNMKYNYFMENSSNFSNKSLPTTKVFVLGDVTFLTGGSYLVLIHPDYENNMTQFKEQLVILNPPNQVHMLWLLPQYVLMAWAEILFIISGMEFSFTQAPTNMRSTLQSCWHLMNAFGNVIIILATATTTTKHTHSQATEFFGFSGAMFVDTIIFCLLAMRYKYVNIQSKEEGDQT